MTLKYNGVWVTFGKLRGDSGESSNLGGLPYDYKDMSYLLPSYHRSTEVSYTCRRRRSIATN